MCPCYAKINQSTPTRPWDQVQFTFHISNKKDLEKLCVFTLLTQTKHTHKNNQAYKARAITK